MQVQNSVTKIQNIPQRVSVRPSEIEPVIKKQNAKINTLLKAIGQHSHELLHHEEIKFKFSLKQVKQVVFDRKILQEALLCPKTTFFKGIGKVILGVAGIIAYSPLFILFTIGSLMNGANGAPLFFASLKPYVVLKKMIDTGRHNASDPFKNKKQLFAKIEDRNNQLETEIHSIHERFKNHGYLSLKIKELETINQELAMTIRRLESESYSCR